MTKRQLYLRWLETLPPLLTKIENKYDNDKLTPLFKLHKQNLSFFENKCRKSKHEKNLLKEAEERKIF